VTPGRLAAVVRMAVRVAQGTHTARFEDITYIVKGTRRARSRRWCAGLVGSSA